MIQERDISLQHYLSEMFHVKLLLLTHVEFEGGGSIERYAKETNIEIISVKMYENEEIPSIDAPIIVMGGPMSVHDENKYPWLVREKEFIQNSILAGKKVLGVCLGAQLISEVLGGKVTANQWSEAGWSEIVFKEQTLFPEKLCVFHWHGETFSLPEKAVHVAKSDLCKNQIFSYNNEKVWGFQCHLEIEEEGIKALLHYDKEMLKREGKGINTEEEILSSKNQCEYLYQHFSKFLTYWINR